MQGSDQAMDPGSELAEGLMVAVGAADLVAAEEDLEAAEVEAAGVAARRVTTPIDAGRITADTPALVTGAGHSRRIPVPCS